MFRPSNMPCVAIQLKIDFIYFVRMNCFRKITSIFLPYDYLRLFVRFAHNLEAGNETTVSVDHWLMEYNFTSLFGTVYSLETEHGALNK